MNPTKRPLAVTIVACVYLAVGIIGFVFHFHDLLAVPREGVWIELTEFLAIIAGAFMLRGQNWARWLAVAWMAFHVGLSAFHEVRELVIHAVIFAVIAWSLFRPDAARYFRGVPIPPI